jgi:undecaprenyl-diphosphatase
MNGFEAVVLSVQQGITEFLPVSSSGHLVLAERLFEGPDFNGEANVGFDIIVHVGTLVSILIVFRHRIAELVRYALGEGWNAMARVGWRGAWLNDGRGRLIVAVLVATAATGVIGLGGKRFFESMFGEPARVGWALCITAVLLGATFLRRTAPPEADDRPTAFDLPLWKALVIGVAQGFAVAPGISRSGSTIAVALLLGMARPLAGEFSLLLAIPAIMAAAVVELRHLPGGSLGLSPAVAALSLVLATVTGLLFVKLLLRFVRGGHIGWFSLYCLAVGIWAIWQFS